MDLRAMRLPHGEQRPSRGHEWQRLVQDQVMVVRIRDLHDRDAPLDEFGEECVRLDGHDRAEGAVQYGQATAGLGR